MTKNDPKMSKLKNRLLNHLKNELFCQIKQSPIHGVGVFAIRPIPKGIDPFRTLKKEREIKFHIDILDKLHPEVAKQMRRFCYYNDEFIYLSSMGLNQMNMIIYLNHSKSPNVKLQKMGGSVTLRKIKKGEELTINYDNEFGDIHTFK